MYQTNLFGQPQISTKASVKGCYLIYEPKGRAREYAALACNVYRGCDHGCIYCFGPSATRRQRREFVASIPRANFLAKLQKEADKYQAAGIRGNVLLSFTTDPYQHLDVKEQVTRHAIEILHGAGLNVHILTKGGSRALRDLGLFTPADAFATTLTLLDDEQSLKWEPNAALPQDRIATIRQFHAAGIPTWVSLEPVLDPTAALQIIRETWHFADVFKVGTLNYHPHAKTIDWDKFAHDAVNVLSEFGFCRHTDPDTLQRGHFYLKRDLACYL